MASYDRRNFTISDPAIYRIRVLGTLDEGWWDYLGDLEAVAEPDTEHRKVTMITGRLVDQGALIGLLDTLFNFGMPLLSVEFLAKKGQTSELRLRM